MKTQTLVIIAVIVFAVLAVSYWKYTEKFSSVPACKKCAVSDTDNNLEVYYPKPTPQIAAKGYSTCDGVVYA
jgi:hypothetical protein